MNGSYFMVPFTNTVPTKYIWVSTSGNDGNSGSSSAPLKSIQAAVDRATPGTAVMVKAGTYTENVRFSKDGGADAPIQLISADGTGAAQINPAKSGYSTIIGHGVQNIVIKGFGIGFSGGDDGNGISFTQSTRDFSDMSKNI